jgi:hypothetical protein
LGVPRLMILKRAVEVSFKGKKQKQNYNEEFDPGSG